MIRELLKIYDLDSYIFHFIIIATIGSISNSFFEIINQQFIVVSLNKNFKTNNFNFKNIKIT